MLDKDTQLFLRPTTFTWINVWDLNDPTPQSQVYILYKMCICQTWSKTAFILLGVEPNADISKLLQILNIARIANAVQVTI